ncbi:MAG: SRPBCC family protein [Ktedonobacteraceae bacterium]|nr:SRPBCC family protein [Ktedonobacteraceae bacterium]
MSEHHASVEVNAPVHQVYSLFTHFNDFPKFMSFVKEVTYYDEQRSHWVAQIMGTREWDAVNEEWIPDRQVAWRSIRGLENRGRVEFSAMEENRTVVDVYLSYTPPAGVLGELVDRAGVDSRFDETLQRDLEHFAQMVEQAPPGTLDPMQSHYLFHSESVIAKGTITQQQRESMERDPMMAAQALEQRDATIRQQAAQQKQAVEQQQAEREQQIARQQQAEAEQEQALMQQAEQDRQQAQQQTAAEAEHPAVEDTPHPVYDTLGGRNASIPATTLGDRDARNERFPKYSQDPMQARAPASGPGHTPLLPETDVESPWNTAIRGKQPENLEESEQQKPPSSEEESK